MVSSSHNYTLRISLCQPKVAEFGTSFRCFQHIMNLKVAMYVVSKPLLL